MKFINKKESKTKRVSSTSKSRLAQFGRCPLRAYKSLRSTKENIENARILDIGILAHEIAASKMFALIDQEYNLEKLTERYPLDVIYEVQNDIGKRVDFERLMKDQVIINIEESFSIELPEIGENFRLIAKPDALTYRDINGEQYICVYEWKSGFSLNAEVDTEALTYAYAAHKNFGLPVLFNRVNIRTGKIWSHEFSPQSLSDIEPMLLSLIKRYKEEMESDITPEFKPGAHCQNCPFITKCEGRKYVSTLKQKYKTVLWAKELAKKYESEVKEAAAHVLANAVPSETDQFGNQVLLPFFEGKYGAVAEISTGYQLSTRKVKKSDIIALLRDTEDFDIIANSLDIKFNEAAYNVLVNKYKVPMKEVVRTSIKIKEKETD